MTVALSVVPASPARPLMRYHGGKWRLGPWIIGLMPRHHVYVESYGGAASLLMQKAPSPVEVYNDLDSEVVGLFRILRDREQTAELDRLLRLTPFSREEYRAAWEFSEDPIECARRLLVRAHMGFGSASVTRKRRSGFRGKRTGKAKSTGFEWKVRVSEGLEQFADRLLGVIIEHEPALDVMRRNDGATTLHMLDPPYLHSTRELGGGQKGYNHEMSESDHEELLRLALVLEGSVMMRPCLLVLARRYMLSRLGAVVGGDVT